jgi:hypothetical protein
MSLIRHIANKDYNAANAILEERIALAMRRRLLEMKKAIAARIVELDVSKMPQSRNIVDIRQGVQSGNKESRLDRQNSAAGKGDLEAGKQRQTATSSLKTTPRRLGPEGEYENPVTKERELHEARVKIVKARIRNGKVQRRKKVSNVKGYTMRGGKLTRMTPAERRRRKLGQKRGKIKRRAKMSRTRQKRKVALRKRKMLGLS